MPYLVDGDDIRLTETAAIMKYICSKWKPELISPDPATFAKAEMIYDRVSQLKNTSTIPCYQGKSNQDIMNDCWPLIQEVVDFLGEKPFLCGDKVLWIDFAFFELLCFLDMLSGEVVCQHYVQLGQYVERF